MANLDKIKEYNSGSIFPENYDETYIATKHVQGHQLVFDDDLVERLINKIKTEGLFFDDVERLVKEIVAGLIKGNIILQGPPGTGKTTLSTIICDSFNVENQLITAVPDWTTYDTIGGLQPSVDDEGNEIIIGKDGRIVESIVNCCNTILRKEHYSGDKQASWLIIDELNRSETDKIFGDLFTVFGSNNLDKKKLHLWFENDANKKTLFVPSRYRMIGLMNNVDKNFVFDLSHGLARRFTFINVLPPTEENIEKEITTCKNNMLKSIPERLSKFGGKAIDSELVKTVLSDDIFLKYEKELITLLGVVRYESEDTLGLGLMFGTAQIVDLYENIIVRLIIDKYLEADDKEKIIKNVIDDAFNDRIIPQVDGCDYVKLKEFVEFVSTNKKYDWFNKTISSVKMMV